MTPLLAEALVDVMLHELGQKIIYARAEFGADYAGRIYSCGPCNTMNAVCAPHAELIDDYPCPECFQPQEALTERSAIGPPNRATRRRRR